MQCGGLNINYDWLLAFLGQHGRNTLRTTCALGMPFHCHLLSWNRGSSQGIASYSTARNIMPFVLWHSHLGRPGVPPSAPQKSWRLSPLNTRITMILKNWDVSIGVWSPLKAICFSAVASWWFLPRNMTSRPAYKVKVKALGSEPWCLLCFKGAVCFLSCSRSFFGVSSISEWFSGSPLSERQSAGLCPTVRLPSERFNRTLFRKVSLCPGKAMRYYFHVVLVTSLLWSSTPDVQCFWSQKAGNSQPLARTVPIICFR